MGSMRVEVALVFAQGVQEVRLVSDERAIEQLMSAGLDPPFHDRVHSRDSDAAEHDRDAGVARMRSNRAGYLPSRSRRRYFTRHPASSMSMARLRAAWATHAAVGWAVTPRIRTRRVACSMTART
jgi:hypothetical protein